MLDLSRWSFGFHNPNHAAALVCALLPLCWGWRRHAWIGRALAAALVAMLLLTQSRTGFLVAGLEAVWWWLGKRRTACMAHVPCRRWWPWVVVGLAVAGLAFWWLGPRLVLDDSILNRPKIWLAGLRLFAANPGGVGLGNSGTLVSAFLLDDGVPEVRTLVNAHLTLLAEFGWIVGWAWCAFIVWALCGMGRSPRVGIAFAGLVASACSSTVFDWPVLFDVHGFGNLGVVNWILSWGMFVFFIGSGVWLVGGRSKLRPSRLESCGVSLREGRNLLRPRVLAVPVCSGGVVLAAWLVPPGNAPAVRDGYAVCGDAPRTLALYDGTWRLRTVRPRVGRDAVVPVRPVSRFPRGIDLSGVGRVALFGTCREWAYLVKGVEVSCVED